MSLLVICFDQSELARIAGFGASFGSYDVLLLSGAPTDSGASKLFVAGFEEVPPADNISRSVSELASNYTHVAAVSSMRAKDLIARVAGINQAAMVTDVVKVFSETEFERPMVAGSVLARVKAETTPIAMTFRPAGFAKSSPGPNGSVEPVTITDSGRVKRVSSSARQGGRPDLSQAKFVVSGGRPLKDATTFEQVIGGFADKFGAAVGATRAAVDSGIAPNDLQVGQTGKVVAPDLYIAAGISGSTQHMAGIKDSKLIVAINKDADAPIFDQADLGIVGDLYEVLPELEKSLS
jgi:electron transfer flavoprotein alpha subunit